MNRDRRQLKVRPHRRPFWLPASTFYFLTAAVAVGVFFLVWAILAEAKEENPWLGAGMMASVTMISGVVLREVILRQRRNSLFSAQRRLDTSVLSMPVPVKREAETNKLTLEQNAYLLEEIKKKSDAAKILGNLSESHREVFTLCAQYIEVTSRELPNVGVGSPRLVAITRGRENAEKIHKYHMLKWAELEIKANVATFDVPESGDDTIVSARKALRVAETALEHYPNSRILMVSRSAISSFIASSQVESLVASARAAENDGDIHSAIEDLQKARDLMLESGPVDQDERRLEEINLRIEDLESRVGL